MNGARWLCRRHCRGDGARAALLAGMEAGCGCMEAPWGDSVCRLTARYQDDTARQADADGPLVHACRLAKDGGGEMPGDESKLHA